MFAKSYQCRVIEAKFITPNVYYVRFRSYKQIKFKPGQFLSVVIPDDEKKGVKRLYSFACSPEQGHKNGYELIVRYQKGGKGSEYITKLQPGDDFKVWGAYGEFTYRQASEEKSVCFISTSTGYAPIRSIMQSEVFLNSRPQKAISILGVRTEEEILFSGETNRNVESVVTVSKPTENWNGFTGRVTDYLESIAKTWDWKHCDFYICGNAQMVQDVIRQLKNQYGVPAKNIIAENFGVPSQKPQKPGTVVPFPSPKPTPIEAEPTGEPIKKVA